MRQKESFMVRCKTLASFAFAGHGKQIRRLNTGAIVAPQNKRIGMHMVNEVEILSVWSKRDIGNAETLFSIARHENFTSRHENIDDSQSQISGDQTI